MLNHLIIQTFQIYYSCRQPHREVHSPEKWENYPRGQGTAVVPSHTWGERQQVNMAAVFSHIYSLMGQHITSALMDLLCCVKTLQPLCLCINSKLPGLIRLHEKRLMTPRGRETRPASMWMFWEVVLTAEQMDSSSRHQHTVFASVVSSDVCALKSKKCKHCSEHTEAEADYQEPPDCLNVSWSQTQ